MNKHTPTPWDISLSDNATPHIMHGNHQGYEDREHLICWMPAEITHNFNSLKNAEHIVRCVNSHEALLRIAELVQHAVLNRADRDWTMMHMDLSEAAELAKQVAPLAAAGAPQ